MSDDALIDWLASGGSPQLSQEDAASRQRREFSARFAIALKQEDLGPTQELHEAAMARQVYEIHMELNKLGSDAYSDVWSTLTASTRRALKEYIAMAAKETNR